MRVGRWGLPLLTVATALALTGPAALAAENGDVGVEGGVIVVSARETIPGESAGAQNDCTYDVVIEDDIAFGVYEVDGVRMYSDTGRWLRKTCDGVVVDIGGFFVFPEGAGFSIPDMLAQAVDALDPSPPVWGSSPDGVEVPMVVQMPTWLWIEPEYWAADFGVRVETPSGRVWAEAHAVPVSAEWHPGDGASVPCAGPGEPFSSNAGESTCAHVFEHSTAGSGGLALSVTVTFDAVGSTSLNPAPVGVGQLSRTSGPVVVTVGEIQAIESG